MYSFDAKEATEKCIDWIREFFKENGPDSPAVLGISGGKDSSVAAALLVRALGKERVIGVLMPEGVQPDIDYSKEICEYLDIKNITVNIGKTVEALKSELNANLNLSCQAVVNIPPRVRMTVLYAVAASNNGRVCNTCNYSEDYVGYATRYGDGAGDFGPISGFTVNEIKKIGYHLGLPQKFIEKVPSDGLSGKTDEDNLGFTYKELDLYIREGIEPKKETKERIDRLHKLNLFKLSYMPIFKYFK